VFQRHAYSLVEKGRAIILPVTEFLKLNLPQLHFSPLHWVPKVDDVLGRFIIDCSNSLEGSHLNTDDALQPSKEYYGDMNLPSIQTIITDWYLWLQSNNYSFQDCLLFKNDVSSAFSQLSFEFNSASSMATMITDKLALVHLSGVFGLNMMPICLGMYRKCFIKCHKETIFWLYTLIC
jgi:hypothetical protein